MPDMPVNVERMIGGAEELLFRASNNNNFARSDIVILLAVEKQLIGIRRAIRKLGYDHTGEKIKKETAGSIGG